MNDIRLVNMVYWWSLPSCCRCIITVCIHQQRWARFKVFACTIWNHNQPAALQLSPKDSLSLSWILLLLCILVLGHPGSPLVSARSFLIKAKQIKAVPVEVKWEIAEKHCTCNTVCLTKSELLHYVAQTLCSSTASNNPLFAEQYF